MGFWEDVIAEVAGSKRKITCVTYVPDDQGRLLRRRHVHILPKRTPEPSNTPLRPPAVHGNIVDGKSSNGVKLPDNGVVYCDNEAMQSSRRHATYITTLHDAFSGTPSTVLRGSRQATFCVPSLTDGRL